MKHYHMQDIAEAIENDSSLTRTYRDELLLAFHDLIKEYKELKNIIDKQS